MKKLTSIAVLSCLTLAGACSGGQTKFEASITGAPGATINLVNVATQASIVSSTDKARQRTISGKAEPMALISVTQEDGGKDFLFFNDGTPISIDITNGALTGSELNQKVNYYKGFLGAIERAYEKAVKDYKARTPEEQKAGEEEFRSLIEGMDESYEEMVQSIIKDNPDNLIPAAFASDIAQTLDDDAAKEFFESDAPYAKHPATLAVKAKLDEQNARWAEIEAAKQAAIGKKFTDLEEPDTEGKMHKLSEFLGRGQWVFVDFWASWCGPCRREMPNVVAAYKKYHPLGLEIVGLSFDNDKEAWLKAIKDLDMPWIHLSDLKGWETVASDTYNIKSIPSSMLVDPEGIIVARDLRGEELGVKLAEIFGK